MKKDLGDLGFINLVFQSCYLGKANTEAKFINLINHNDIDYSRYIFFYINYLISKNRLSDAEEITNNINILDSSIIIQQAKSWIEKGNSNKIEKIFSCKNKNDLLSEFIFLIANLYSSQNNYENDA